jgi:hypothetical protein
VQTQSVMAKPVNAKPVNPKHNNDNIVERLRYREAVSSQGVSSQGASAQGSKQQKPPVLSHGSVESVLEKIMQLALNPPKKTDVKDVKDNDVTKTTNTNTNTNSAVSWASMASAAAVVAALGAVPTVLNGSATTGLATTATTAKPQPVVVPVPMAVPLSVSAAETAPNLAPPTIAAAIVAVPVQTATAPSLTPQFLLPPPAVYTPIGQAPTVSPPVSAPVVPVPPPIRVATPLSARSVTESDDGSDEVSADGSVDTLVHEFDGSSSSGASASSIASTSGDSKDEHVHVHQQPVPSIGMPSNGRERSPVLPLSIPVLPDDMQIPAHFFAPAHFNTLVKPIGGFNTSTSASLSSDIWGGAFGGVSLSSVALVPSVAPAKGPSLVSVSSDDLKEMKALMASLHARVEALEQENKLLLQSNADVLKINGGFRQFLEAHSAQTVQDVDLLMHRVSVVENRVRADVRLSLPVASL